MKSRTVLSIVGLLLMITFVGCQSAEPPVEEAAAAPTFEGCWNITETFEERTASSWIQIKPEGDGWTGLFLHRGGHPMPAAVEITGDELKVTMQKEDPEADWSERTPPVLIGKLEGERLVGTGTSWREAPLTFTGERAPDRLEGSDREVEWGEPIDLLAGGDLSAWQVLEGRRPSQWKVEDGMLVNAESGANLRTVDEFRDFKLHIEFKIPPKSNSGIYMRGRYETQVADTFGMEPFSRAVGGIYGHLTPTVNAAKPAGEWNTVDLTLVGYRVTVVVNDQTTIDGQLLPGITGGALDPNESEPGPIMLQGDHGTVSYRNIVITPAM